MPSTAVDRAAMNTNFMQQSPLSHVNHFQHRNNSNANDMTGDNLVVSHQLEGPFLDIDLSDEGTDELVKSSILPASTGNIRGTGVAPSSSPCSILTPDSLHYHHKCASSISSLSSIASYSGAANNGGAPNGQISRSGSEASTPAPSEALSFNANKKEERFQHEDLRKNLLSTLSSFLKSRPSGGTKSPSFGSRSMSQPSASPEVVSTCGLILNERPSGLPSKSSEEAKRHQEEYRKIIEAAKQKEQERLRSYLRTQNRRLEEEDRVQQLSSLWKHDVLPNWNLIHQSRRVRELFWEGLPSSVRGQVWVRSIPNHLDLTEDAFLTFREQLHAKEASEKEALTQQTAAAEQLFLASNENFLAFPVCECSPSDAVSPDVGGKSPSVVLRSSGERLCEKCGGLPRSRENMRGRERPISESILGGYRCSGAIGHLRLIRLDLPRTFPTLSLFHEGGPFHETLFELLGAYVCYRPDMGYVQGMSFLAATLLLAMEQSDAFICFANILNQPCLHAFYSLEESTFQGYFETFDRLLHAHLPRIQRHFHKLHLELKIFLIEWIVTLFSKTLPLECVFRVWDLYSVDGEAVLFRTALGILSLFEEQICTWGFDQLATFLTSPLPQDSPLLTSPEQLISAVRAIPPLEWPPEGVTAPQALDEGGGVLRLVHVSTAGDSSRKPYFSKMEEPRC